MKKFFVLVITLFFTAVSTFAADVSKLYRIKNANSDAVNKVLTPYLKRQFPNLIKKQNYYILENKQKGYYYVIIISDKDENCYLYYMSNNEDEDLRKDILKTLKNNDLKNRKVIDSSLKSYFYGEAYTNLAHSNVSVNLRSKEQSVIPPQSNSPVNAKEINYDFSDEAQERFDSINNPDVVNLEIPAESNLHINYASGANVIRLPQIGSAGSQSAYNPYSQQTYNNINQQKSSNILTGSVVMIPDGTSFTAALLSDISSESIVNNDRISAELDQDWIYNGQLIAPAGSILNGRAVDTKSASFAMGNGQIGLLFDEIMTPDGAIIPLKTNKVYIVGNNSRALNITKRVAGGAAAGLLLSGISMLFGADPTQALIYGMSIGAGSGAITAISSKGEEIQLIEGSQLQIMLTQPLTVQTYRQEGY